MEGFIRPAFTSDRWKDQVVLYHGLYQAAATKSGKKRVPDGMSLSGEPLALHSSRMSLLMHLPGMAATCVLELCTRKGVHKHAHACAPCGVPREDHEDQTCHGDADCVDKNSMCPTWAAIGECHANPNYMVGRPERSQRGHCRRSCGRCGVFDPFSGMPDSTRNVLSNLMAEQHRDFVRTTCDTPCGALPSLAGSVLVCVSTVTIVSK